MSNATPERPVIQYRVLERFPEPAYTALLDEAFADYEESELLSAVAREEAAAQAHAPAAVNDRALRIGAFRGETLVGWTFANPEGSSLLYMVNSGVARAERQQGIYSELVRRVIAHAREQGHVFIQSRHAAGNNAVIIAKLKLGFFVSGFEYSEVYGPLVRLSYLVNDRRRALYDQRARPIRRVRPSGS